MDKVTQCARIRAYLDAHGNASARDLFILCGCNSPRKRLSEMGDTIGSYWDESVDEFGHKTRYKRYYLIGGDNNG